MKINFAGQKYNKLTFIELSDRKNEDGTKLWKLKCDCGKFVYLASRYVVSGNNKSCGCLRNEIINKDYTGQKFNMLTFIAPSVKDKHNHRLWELKCACGNIIYKKSHIIVSGKLKSCGCYQHSAEFKAILSSCQNKYRKWDPIISSAKTVWRTSYKELDFDIFYQISQKDCYYCGNKPEKIFNVANKISNNRGKPSELQKLTGNFCYNGLDRVDNTKTHTVDNIVAACYGCNLKKGALTTQNFIKHIIEIYNFLKIDDWYQSMKHKVIIALNSDIPLLYSSYLELGNYNPNLLTIPHSINHPIIGGAKRVWQHYYNDMEFDSFIRLTQENCSYCGSSPHNNHKGFIYQGIDRIDNSKGHIPDNCFPSCWECNRFKGKFSLEKFISDIFRIYNHIMTVNMI